MGDSLSDSEEIVDLNETIYGLREDVADYKHVLSTTRVRLQEAKERIAELEAEKDAAVEFFKKNRLTEYEQDAISRVLSPCPDCGETCQVPARDGTMFCSTGGCEKSCDSIEQWGYGEDNQS